MHLAGRQFSPPWWAWLLFGVIGVIMLMLGRWQLDRAALKVTMGEAAAVARNAPPVAINELDDPVSAASSYTRVEVVGEWLPDGQFLWDNRTHKGQAGFEVITPMRMSNGELALINRGWLPLGTSRSDLPDVSLAAEFTDSIQTVTGFFTRPSKGFASGEASPADADWPKLLQYFDYSLLEELLSASVIAGVVQVQELNAGDTLAGPWLTGNWQPDAAGPAKHYSYAFQWFAMAAALAVIFVLVNLKRPNEA